MKTSFLIDRVCYVMEFTEGHTFLFYVDALRSERQVQRMSAFERAFWDDPQDTVWTETKVAARHVFAIRRQVEDFLGQAIRHYRPYYFTYSANEVAKVSLYERVARRLARRFGYQVVTGTAGTGLAFRFYRLPNG